MLVILPWMEKRRNKYLPSKIIRNIILFILRNNVFKFASCVYKQIMGTPMAPNYANLFMTQVETDMLNDYEAENGLRPIIWLRYIEDIFFLWTYDEQSLKDFIEFIQKYSESKSMKSVLKYDVHYSIEEVIFLDCKVKLAMEVLRRNFLRKLTMHICIFWLRHAIQNTQSMVYPRDNLLESGGFAPHQTYIGNTQIGIFSFLWRGVTTFKNYKILLKKCQDTISMIY